jgi:hypothetical protein
MKPNLGSGERLARIVFGTGLVFVSIAWDTSFSSCVLAIIGLVVFFTGMAGRCPLCAILNVNSCKSG